MNPARNFGALILAAALLLSVSPTAAVATQGLPPLECVHLLRDARIHDLEGEPADALRLIRQGMKQFPDELVPLIALWEHDRTFRDLSAQERDDLRSHFIARLGDTDKELPLAVLEQLTLSVAPGDPRINAILRVVPGRLESSADQSRLLFIQATLLEKEERWEDALLTLDQLHQLDPSSRVLWWKIDLAEKLERWDTVVQLLNEQIAAEELSTFDARTLLIPALAKAGQIDQLEKQVELLTLEDSYEEFRGGGFHLDLFMETAWELRDRGHDPAAEKLFRLVAEDHPEDAKAQKILLYLYATEEERATSLAKQEELFRQQEDPHLLMEEGVNQLEAQNYEMAFELLERAATELSSSESAWFNLGLVAQRLERWTTAESALRKAIELNPDRADSFFNLGIALVQQERYREALEPLQQVLALDDTRRDVHYYLYSSYSALGNRQAAGKHYQLYKGATE